MTTSRIVKEKMPSATLYSRCASRLMKDTEYVIIAGMKTLGTGRTKRIAWRNAMYSLMS